jgi:alpha-amylase
MGGSITLYITILIWRKTLKKLLILGALFLLSACETQEVTQPVIEEPVVEEPIVEEPVFIEPVSFLNHEDAGMLPLADGVTDLGVCYQIFVISFADSNQDGYGDLNGITENLDYLSDLNVDCLWLTPIHPSPTYHKYDVLDYYDVDPQFGTLDDAQRLFDEAEARGISVIIDLVVNHTSKSHPWFQSNPEYYRKISVGHPSYSTRYWHREGDLQYFAYFWDQMPELNLDDPVVRELIFEVARYWLDLGVDGFRLDAVRHYFDVHEYPFRTPTLSQNVLFLKEFNAVVKDHNPAAFLVAEAWSEAGAVAKYQPGVDGAFNFDIASRIISTVNNSSDSLVDGLVNDLLRIQELYELERPDIHDHYFLANHDQDRVMSQFGSDLSKAKLAASILFSLPGVSWIYYGEEIGMTGARTAAATDAQRRQPMIWQNEYQITIVDGYELDLANKLLQPRNELFTHYQTVTALKADDVIRLGDLISVEKTQTVVLAFVRSYENTHYVVIHNLSNQENTVQVSEAFEVVYSFGFEHTISEGITMPPRSSIVVEVATPTIRLSGE